MILAGAAIIFAYYILGAYATTDILRLLRGAPASVRNEICYCPHCHHALRLRDQVPIFSYFFCHGRCRWCGAPIPFEDTFLEIFICSGCSILALICSFSWTSMLLAVLFYEGTKLVFILLKKPRQDHFVPQLFRSITNNCVIFLLIAFLYLIHSLAV